MARILVINPSEGSSVPFLRGILTRSLQKSGLGFEDAYRLASEVRDELSEAQEESVEISCEGLREIVSRHLLSIAPDALTRYQAPPPPKEIMVEYPDGHTQPYSRGRYALSLRASGLSGEEASRIATLAYDSLRLRRVTSIDRVSLRRLTHGLLRKKFDEEAAHRYLVWREFQSSGRSLLIMIGGVAGSGKSTVSSRVAHLLEIIRTQSTDMLREVMRMTMPEGLLPILHRSSFRAGEALHRGQDNSEPLTSEQLAEGYLHQMELVSVACKAAVQRAAGEHVSLILEGVHIHPSLVERVQESTDAVVVPIMLASLKPAHLRKQIERRGYDAPMRKAGRYLSKFDSLWQLQSFLLDEADHANLAIVSNEDLDDTVQQVILLILEELGQHFEGSPERMLTPSP